MEPAEATTGILAELDLPAEEIDMLAQIASLFSLGKSPEPTDADTRRLVKYLSPAMPQPSPVRDAIRAHRARQSPLAIILATARTQVSVLRLAFWIVSAGILALGAITLCSGIPLNHALLLQALGPLLSYVGTALAFRGVGLRVLECELVCPPSLMQIVLARLMIILGYDLGLGIIMTAIVSIHDRLSMMVLLSHWLMPLLLVMGLAFALSQWLSFARAAMWAYGAWIGILGVQVGTQLSKSPIWSATTPFELIAGILGMLLLCMTLVRLHETMPHWLSHA